jgi:hypothetical protein
LSPSPFKGGVHQNNVSASMEAPSSALSKSIDDSPVRSQIKNSMIEDATVSPNKNITINVSSKDQSYEGDDFEDEYE